MKYKSEIGESMVQPNEKLKKTLLILGITGAVYVGFRYLLPLVIPFLCAYGMALLLRPSAFWIAARCRVRIREKYYGIPPGIAGAVELILIVTVLGIGVYIGGERLYREAGMLIEQIPRAVSSLDRWLTSACHRLEGLFHLKDNCLVLLTREMLMEFVNTAKNAAMPYLMLNSMTVFRWFMQITVVWVILLIAVMLSLQEMEVWKRRRENSIYQKEFAMIGRRLAIVGNAYLKTQGTIMLLTMSICTTAFWLMGNPYSILVGIGVGILDALPIFGTGTVLIPWTLITLMRGKFGRAAILLGLYVICYLLRELLETKMMGDKVGLSPLETLISMYVGLQLFGLLGFLLGPIGLLLIEDLVSAAEGSEASGGTAQHRSDDRSQKDFGDITGKVRKDSDTQTREEGHPKLPREP